MVEGAGFEPAKPVRAPDLQSGGFNHSPTPPGCCVPMVGRTVSAPYMVYKYPLKEPQRGLEPLTCRLQIGCAANCATGARFSTATKAGIAPRRNLKQPRRGRGRPVFVSRLNRLRKSRKIVNRFS